jgi:chemotaxis signal transduction protein
MTMAPDALAILRLRAQKLALVEASEQEAAAEPYVAFTLGGHSLGIPLAAMLYAGRLRHLTAVPGAEAFLLGVTALGGHVVSVLDAAALLRLPRHGLSDIAACLVVSYGNRKIGLGAEQLLGIEDLPQSCIKSFAAGGREVPRIAVLPSRQLLLLELPQLLADPRLAQE